MAVNAAPGNLGGTPTLNHFLIGHDAWGFLGGWWGGMLMGMSLGLVATLGKAPPLAVREVLPG